MKATTATILLLVLAVLTGCQFITGAATAGTLTVNDALNTLEEIDAKYAHNNANYKLERINEHLIDEDAIDGMLQDLKLQADRYDKEAVKDDRNLIQTVFKAREEMLLSQKQYHLSSKLGRDAIITDTILCKEAQKALELARLLDLTRLHGTSATRAWDTALQELTNRDDFKTRERIGVSTETTNNRLHWYYSPFKEMAIVVDRNRIAVSQYCE